MRITRKRPSVEVTSENELFEQIGRLKMKVEWLKYSGRSRLRSRDNAWSPITTP